MAHDEQAPCQLAERLDALRAQPVAPVAARGRMLRMRGEDGGRTPLPALLSEEREHLPGILGIKVSRRLIGQHEPRLADERARDRHALQLAAGAINYKQDCTFLDQVAVESGQSIRPS